MSENGQLTELGRIAQEAFQGAYNTDPVEFSALQDAYAYNSYYAVTEAWLKSGLSLWYRREAPALLLFEYFLLPR